MLVNDLYNILDSFYNLKGLNLINGDDVIMYLPEALGMTYLEYSTKKIKKFIYNENGYIDVYI